MKKPINSEFLEVDIVDGLVQVSLILDPEFKSIIENKSPQHIYDKLPDNLVRAVIDNKSVPLDMSRVKIKDGLVYV